MSAVTLWATPCTRRGSGSSEVPGVKCPLLGDHLWRIGKASPKGKYSPGTSLEPLPLLVHGVAHKVTALICYEDILPRFTNDAVRQGDPELLVNMTNDAWFGDTAEPWEHLALAQLRAVEHRRYLVRGTNSGVSAVVDPVGRVVAHSGTFREERVLSPIHWMRSRTLYELIGDWPWLAVSATVGVWAFRRRSGPAQSLIARLNRLASANMSTLVNT